MVAMPSVGKSLLPGKAKNTIRGQLPLRAIKPLILASASPRRQQMLRQLGLHFTVCPADIDETRLSGEAAVPYAKRLAAAKAQKVAECYPEAYVLAADTVVCKGKKILGKPESNEQARQMLTVLAGTSHWVRTAYCLKCIKEHRENTGCVAAKVWFASHSTAVIDAYLATGEPMDKAGAYGIQGLGAFLVERLQGSYTTVVGLPLAEIIGEMLALGIISPDGATSIYKK